MILGDTYVFNRNPGDLVLEVSTLAGLFMVATNEAKSAYLRDNRGITRDYTVLGVVDRRENDQLNVYRKFQENVTKKTVGRLKDGVPWVPRANMSNKFRVEYEASQPCLNEGQSSQDLQKDYEEIDVNKLKTELWNEHRRYRRGNVYST